MKRLDEYLDYEKLRIITIDDKEYIGRPISVDYADETESGEDEIDLENPSGVDYKFIGFRQSEIKDIEIVL